MSDISYREEQAALGVLRRCGWTCEPPAATEPPSPEIGQFWVAPNPAVPPRRIERVKFTGDGDISMVYYKIPHDKTIRTSSGEAWRFWVSANKSSPTVAPSVAAHRAPAATLKAMLSGPILTLYGPFAVMNVIDADVVLGILEAQLKSQALATDKLESLERIGSALRSLANGEAIAIMEDGRYEERLLELTDQKHAAQMTEVMVEF